MKSVVRRLYHAGLSAMPAKLAMNVQHMQLSKRWPNIDRPRTLNEKILHRKLHEKNELFVQLSDKVKVKEHVAARLGHEYVIPTLWSGRKLPPDIASRLNGPVVVKANHTSGRNKFVMNAAAADWQAVAAETEPWLDEPYNRFAKERWYNRMERLLLIEPFIGGKDEPPPDYKFFVFDGVVRAIQVDTDRFSGHKRALHSPDWRRLPVSLQFPMLQQDLPKPEHLEQMLEAASKLGREFAFVRIDLYDLPEGPKFGEMTFAPGGGFERFTPSSFDGVLGSYWTGSTT